MRSVRSNNREESFEVWRQRMLDDTSRFIEWGLKNPDKVEWIPKHAVGRGVFSERITNIFWNIILSNEDMPE